MSLRQRKEIQEVLRILSPRVLIPTFITLFWLGTMAWLVQKEFFASKLSVRPAAAPRSIDTWLGVYLSGDKRVGYIHYSAQAKESGGLPGTQLQLQSHLSLAALGPTVAMDIQGEGWLPDDAGTGMVTLDISSGGEHALRINASVTGGVLDGTMQTAGQSIPLHYPIGDTLRPSKGLGAALNASSMEVGKEYTVDSFDPMSLSAAKLRVKCLASETLNILGKSVPAKALEVNLGGMASKLWVSANDEVLRAEIPLGFTLQVIAPEDAKRRDTRDASTDLLAKSAIQASGKPVRRGLTRMTVRVTGIDANTPIPSDDTQHYDGAGVLTLVSRLAPQTHVDIAERGAGFERDLAADPLIQSDAPEIRAQAQAIVGAETDRWKAATALYRWVYESLEKKMVFSVPSALDVLKSRVGDCNEHTTLYVAMARAVGIPARIAIGVVWSDQLHGFYYHAWPEVYVGAWMGLDPTLGQPVADATHIKLLNGDVSQWGKLLPFVGKARIEVLEAE